MASNRVKSLARQFYTWVTDGGVSSGDPCLVGQLAGVALYAKDTNNGTTVDFEGAYSLSVHAITDGPANSAVYIGDAIYYVTGDTSKLSKKSAGGVFFGTAIGPASGPPTATLLISGGNTANIAVRVGPSPGNVGGLNTVGQSTIGAGTITNADLAATAVQSNVVQAGAIVAAGLATAAVTGVKLGTGILHVGLYAGTASGANITGVTGMTAADEIVSVLSFTTAASIASAADRTSEYAAGAGLMTKAAGTVETNNQILAIWLTHH